MKHTKKRAIFTAVAMLVVSAIALSSATYAWFAAGDSVNVGLVNANVANSSGAILISANNVDWGISIDEQALKDAGGNLIPDNLIPVSAIPTNSGTTFIGGSIQDAVFTAKSATTEYIKYKAYLKASVDCEITIQPTFNAGPNGAFCYGVIEIPAGRTTPAAHIVMNGQGTRSYYPIKNVALVAPDNNLSNSIVDAAECTPATDLGAQVSAVTSGTLSMTLTADTVYTFYGYIWAEGQDSACKGVVPQNEISMSVSIVKI